MIVKDYMNSGRSFFNNIDLEELFGGLIESIETYEEILTYKESLEDHNRNYCYRHIGLENMVSRRLKGIKRNFGLEEDKKEEEKKDDEKANDGIMGTLKSIGNKIMEVIKEIWNHILNLFGAGTDKKDQETKDGLAAVSEAVKKTDNKLVIPVDELIRKLYVIWVMEGEEVLKEIKILSEITNSITPIFTRLFNDLQNVDTKNIESSVKKLQDVVSDITNSINLKIPDMKDYKDQETKDGFIINVKRLILSYNNIITITLHKPENDDMSEEEKIKNIEKVFPMLGSESNADYIKEKWGSKFGESKELDYNSLNELVEAIKTANTAIDEDIKKSLNVIIKIDLSNKINAAIKKLNTALDDKDKNSGEIEKANNDDIRNILKLIKTASTLAIKLTSGVANVLRNNHFDKLIKDLGQVEQLQKFVEKQKTYKETAPEQEPKKQGGDGSNVTA